MQTRIFIMRNGRTITLMLDGQTRQFTYDNQEAALEALKTLGGLKTAAQSGGIDAYNELKAMLDPSYRLQEYGGLTRDTQGNYYLGEYAEPMPMELVYRIREYHDAGLPVHPLVNFFHQLMLNPEQHVRRDLFRFADRFSFPITDNGYFIAYKSVAWKGSANKELGIYIAQQYIYFKAAGKPLSQYLVYEETNQEGDVISRELYDFERFAERHPDQERTTDTMIEDIIGERVRYRYETVSPYAYATLTEEERAELCYDDDEEVYQRKIAVRPQVRIVGQLEYLFNQMSDLFDQDVPTFTDLHTKKMTIRLGTPVQMDREKCNNNPNDTCSSGLHVGAPGYVQQFGQTSKDRYVIACLVSPRNIVAVPKDYNFEKMRCCEYLPYAICELNPDGTIREIDTQYFEEDYIGFEREALQQELSALATREKPDAERERVIRDRLFVIQ